MLKNHGCDSRGNCDIPYSPSFPRIGFVFIVNTDDEVDGADDIGVALWRAFNYIAEEHDVSQAFISIVQVSVLGIISLDCIGGFSATLL